MNLEGKTQNIQKKTQTTVIHQYAESFTKKKASVKQKGGKGQRGRKKVGWKKN
jgi:hypothetical protein